MKRDSRKQTFILIVITVLTLLGMAWSLVFFGSRQSVKFEENLLTIDSTDKQRLQSESHSFTFDKSKWEVAGIKFAKASILDIPQFYHMTGKLTLNEDRLAQVYPQVEGVVHYVPVRFGQSVKTGQALVLIDSQQIGAAKLELTKSRLARRLAEVDHAWTTSIDKSVQELITSLKAGIPLNQIEMKFADRDMGRYRAQLVSAYANLYKSRADYVRLKSLSDKGITAGKDFLTAESAFEADQATMQALLEQIKFTSRQRRIAAEQALEKAKTAQSNSELNLKILGVSDIKLSGENTLDDKGSFTLYTIVAPFDGTIIMKDVTLEERVDPTTHLLTVADLSTLWLRADIYEKQIPLVKGLEDSKIQFRTTSYPDRTFEARVFFSGAVIDEKTRTLPLTAIVDNSEGLLTAGMFVDIQLPGDPISVVLAISSDAIMMDANQPFVFVHLGSDQFEKRNVTLGQVGGGITEIKSGLSESDSVVIEGSFFLKSEMLADQFADDD